MLLVLFAVTPSAIQAQTSVSQDVHRSNLSGASESKKPFLAFTAGPTTIHRWESATLTWSATNATSCTASGGWSGAKGVRGSESVRPTSTTTYTLTCSGPGGSVGPVTIRITVSQTPPITLTFTATPTTINRGESATLTWSATNATSCTAFGSTGWIGAKPVTGSQEVRPTSTASYTLFCSGPTGSRINARQTVRVIVRPTPPITLTFTATPTTINQGESATLTWSATNATSCTASGGWSGAKGVRGSESVRPTSTTTYTLTCRGPGGSVTKSASVTVVPAVSSIVFEEYGTNYGYDNYTEPSHPWKSLETGRTGTVRAVIIPSTAYPSVSFSSTVPSNATVSPAIPTSGGQILTNQGGIIPGASQINARVNSSNFAYYQAATYRRLRKTVAVTLVHRWYEIEKGYWTADLSTDISDAAIIAALREVYKQAVIEWTVVRRPACWAKFDINNDGMVDVGGWMTAEMQRIRDACRSSHEYNIFLVDNPSDGSTGFMEYNQKYGFVHADKGNTRTVAHELGHGVGGLEHTPSDGENIMYNYNSATKWRLRKNQWDQLNPSR